MERSARKNQFGADLDCMGFGAVMTAWFGVVKTKVAATKQAFFRPDTCWFTQDARKTVSGI